MYKKYYVKVKTSEINKKSGKPVWGILGELTVKAESNFDGKIFLSLPHIHGEIWVVPKEDKKEMPVADNENMGIINDSDVFTGGF